MAYYVFSPCKGHLDRNKEHILTLSSEDNDVEDEQFAHAIRVADIRTIKDLLNKNSTDILHSKLSSYPFNLLGNEGSANSLLPMSTVGKIFNID